MKHTIKSLIVILSIACLFSYGNSADCLYKLFADSANSNACTACAADTTNCLGCTSAADCTRCVLGRFA